jgi:phenylalanyl-tRNA synthetase beta chain
VDPSSEPVEVLNPLSEDQRYLRYGLGPAMLQYFARVDRPIRIFEIGHVFFNDSGPREAPTLAFGFTAEPLDEPAWRDSHFLRLKGDCERLVTALTGRTDIEVARDTRNGLHPGKTAVVLLDGREVANVGAVDPRLLKSFDVRLPAYAASIYIENIPDYRVPRYVPPSKFPSTYRDLALLCDLEVPAQSIERVLRRALAPLVRSVAVFDEYRGAQVPDGKKSLAVRAVLQRDDATITDEEADRAMSAALAALRDEAGATLRE